MFANVIMQMLAIEIGICIERVHVRLCNGVTIFVLHLLEKFEIFNEKLNSCFVLQASENAKKDHFCK